MAYDWKRIDCGNGKCFEYKVDLFGKSDFTDKNIYQTTIRTEFGVPFRSLGTITKFLPWLKDIGVKCEDKWEDKYFYTVSAPHYNPNEEDN